MAEEQDTGHVASAQVVALNQFGLSMRQTTQVLNQFYVRILNITTAQQAQQRQAEQAARQGEKGVRNTKKQDEASADLTRSLRTASVQAQVFAKVLLGLPGMFLGLARQATGGEQTGVMSTLSKSFQLVALQLSGVFLPMIAKVTMALQDMAETIKKSRNATEAAGKIMEKTGVPGLKESGKGFQKWDFWMGGGKEEMERVTAENQSSTQQAIARSWKMMSEAEKKLWAEKGIKTLKQFEQLADTGQMVQVQQALQKDPRYAAAREETRARMRQAGKEGKDVRIGAGGGPAGQAAGGPPKTMTDVRPPGYQAQFNDLGEVRRQMQLSALNMTQLDIKLLQESVRIQQEFLQTLQRMESQQAAPALPPK